MIGATSERRPATPVRLTVASQLGHEIDGAWWPRTGRMAGELPELVALLVSRLGKIIDIQVNWSSEEGPPEFNSFVWEGKRQPVMTLSGVHARAKLVLVPHQPAPLLR